MHLNQRIAVFQQLGQYLRSPASQEERQTVAQLAYAKNHWFTPDRVNQALEAIAGQYLDENKLTQWAQYYQPEPQEPRVVGVVMAGNIPAVGFHDLLCVLVSGHRILAKLSSQDIALIQYLIQKIREISPELGDRIEVAERLNKADAYIATGSDNTARYFSYYFGSKPHIIRRNRTSVAVLTGNESDEELRALGHDILDYFGLGCRNVSKLFVPENYTFDRLLGILEAESPAFFNHHKYNNNYEYNKSIYLINQVPHFDNGFLLVTENEGLVSPISVLYVGRYQDEASVQQQLDGQRDKIQCIASAGGQFPGSLPLGLTQRPTLYDYADGIDTMAFLKGLS